MAKNEQTSKKMATKASKALKSKVTSPLTKSLAGALLTQAPNKPNPKKK